MRGGRNTGRHGRRSGTRSRETTSTRIARPHAPRLLQGDRGVRLLGAGQPGLGPVDEQQVQPAAAQLRNRALRRRAAAARVGWGHGARQLKCARVFEACGSGSSGMGSMGRAGSRHVAAAAMGRAWAGGPAQYSTHRTASGRFSSFHSLLVMKSSSRRPCGVDGGMSGWVQGWVPAQHACSQRRRSRASPTSSSEQQQQRSRKASCLESAAHLRNEVLQALPHQRLVAVRGGAVNVAVAACSVGGAGGRRSRSGSAGSRQRPRPRSSNRRHGRNPSLPAALVGRPQRAHTRAPS